MLKTTTLGGAELVGIEPLLSHAPGICERQSGLDRCGAASRYVIFACFRRAGEVNDYIGS
jgi:hypothetical protein